MSSIYEATMVTLKEPSHYKIRIMP